MESVSPSTAQPGEAAALLAGLTPDEQAAALALLRGTSHVAVLFDAVGTIRWISPSCEPVLGYTPEKLVGTNLLTYLHPDDLHLAVAIIELASSSPLDGALARDDTRGAADFRLRHATGRWVALEVLFNSFLATAGIHGNLVISREATGRHALDEALMALAHDVNDEALLRLLAFLEVRVSGTATGLFWPDGGAPWTSLTIPSDLLTAEGPWVDAMKSGGQTVLVNLGEPVAERLGGELATAAREAGYVACWAFPVPVPRNLHATGARPPIDDRHQILGSLVLWSRTLTEPLVGHLPTIERVAALAYLALSRREADRERAARLEMEQEQNRRLQELDTMKTDLVLSVSHELRTPLTSIISFAELLDGDPDIRAAEEGAQYLGIIKRNAERLLHMVGDLLFLGRLESGISPLTIGPVNLPDVVTAAVTEARPTAAAKGVSVEVTTARGRPFSGDLERIRQLVDNLLSNAVKYTEAGGSVRISAQPTDDGWHLVVADDGIGIPAAEADHVFDRFYRGTNARRAQIAGSGLGLVIAQAVTVLHHGAITLSTQEGRGSTFEVVLRGA